MWLFLPVDNNRNWECKDEYSEESTEASNNLNNEGKKLVKVREARRWSYVVLWLRI